MPLDATEITRIAIGSFAYVFRRARNNRAMLSHLIPKAESSEVQNAVRYFTVLKATLGGIEDGQLATTLDEVFGKDTRPEREASAHEAITAIVTSTYPFNGKFDWPRLDNRRRGMAILSWYLANGTYGRQFEAVDCCDDKSYVEEVDRMCSWWREIIQSGEAMAPQDLDDFLQAMRILCILARPGDMSTGEMKAYALAACALGLAPTDFFETVFSAPTQGKNAFGLDLTQRFSFKAWRH